MPRERSKVEDQTGFPRRGKNHHFVSPSREEQEKCNSPFNHARKNRVGHADHGIHVNSHDVLVLLFSNVDEVCQHRVGLAHIVDYKCIRSTPMETLHLEYIPNIPMSKLRRRVLSSRRVSGSFFTKPISFDLSSGPLGFTRVDET